MEMAKEKKENDYRRTKKWVFFGYGSKDRRPEVRKAHAVAGALPSGLPAS